MKRKEPSDPLSCLIIFIFFIPIGAFYLLRWVIKGIIILSNKKRKIEIDFSEIDSMDGHSFERFVAYVLRNNGYRNVVVTKACGDFGADITATIKEHRWAFQCKCYQSNLGIHPIQEIYTSLKKYNAEIGVVVTNSYFTRHAQELAATLGVLLWDRNKLAELIVSGGGQLKTSRVEIGEEHNKNQGETSHHQIIMERNNMATRIGAGKYVFGEDIPLGKYNLRVVSGSGSLTIQNGKADQDGCAPSDWMSIGKDADEAKSYNGLSLPYGWWFTLEGDVVVEITRSKMLEIE